MRPPGLTEIASQRRGSAESETIGGPRNRCTGVLANLRRQRKLPVLLVRLGRQLCRNFAPLGHMHFQALRPACLPAFNALLARQRMHPPLKFSSALEQGA